MPQAILLRGKALLTVLRYLAKPPMTISIMRTSMTAATASVLIFSRSSWY